MMRLIDADMLMELARNHVNRTVDCNDIARFPIVDAVPVVHARWNRKDGKAVMFDIEWECNKCGCAISTSGIYTPAACGWNFCPSCGAKMDGGAEDDNQ